MAIRIVDVTDEASFALVPPCADPRFDHRSCNYWEDADRGSKTVRAGWPHPGPIAAVARSRPVDAFGGRDQPRDPFDQGEPRDPVGGRDPFGGREQGGEPRDPFGGREQGGEPRDPLDGRDEPPRPFAGNDQPPSALGGRDETPFNPFAPATRRTAFNPFAAADDATFNPFAPAPRAAPAVGGDAPPKLRLLARGAAVFGSYAKVLLADEVPAGYAQFGPLSAYPRAMRTRDLYPRLPQSPLPAVITCIATTASARERGYAARLIEAVCDDLAGRGFSAVEAYPEVGARPDATSAAQPAFWTSLGFQVAAQDDRFPVLRREFA